MIKVTDEQILDLRDWVIQYRDDPKYIAIEFVKSLNREQIQKIAEHKGLSCSEWDWKILNEQRLEIKKYQARCEALANELQALMSYKE
jgi:hypothetical protein